MSVGIANLNISSGWSNERLLWDSLQNILLYGDIDNINLESDKILSDIYLIKQKMLEKEPVCSICNFHCSLCVSCATCNKKFGRACLSMNAMHRLYGSFNCWKCLKCYYKELSKSKIIKLVDDEINNILNKTNLNKHHSLFTSIKLNDLLSFEKSDFHELGLSKQDTQTIYKYIYENYKTNYRRDLIKPQYKCYSVEELSKLDYEAINNLSPSMIKSDNLTSNYQQEIDFWNKRIQQTTEAFANMLLDPESSAYKGFINTFPEYEYIKLPPVKIQKPFDTYRVPTPLSEIDDCERNYEKTRDRYLFITLRDHYYTLQVYLTTYTLHNASSYGRFFSTDTVLKKVAVMVKNLLIGTDLYIDMCCGTNAFAPLLGIRYKSFDLYPPKYNVSSGLFEMTNWFDVTELPENCVIGLNPPFGKDGETAIKFLNHAIEFKPRMLIVISPGSIELKFRPPKEYKLILKNTALCSGDSFYVPGNFRDNKLIAPETNTCLFVWRKELNSGDVLPGFRPVYTLSIKRKEEYLKEEENKNKRLKK